MDRRLKDDIIAGTIAGLISGAITGAVLTGAAYWLNNQQNEKFDAREEAREEAFAEREAKRDRSLAETQERRENLRFVRDVATAQEGAMPFQSLDLQGMDLSGLRLNCRDEERGSGQCLFSADFSGANLTGAIMQNMDLSEAVFTGATIVDVDFRGSRLHGVDMTGVRTADGEEGVAAFDSVVFQHICYNTAPFGVPDGVELPLSSTEANPEWESPVCTEGFYG